MRKGSRSSRERREGYVGNKPFVFYGTSNESDGVVTLGCEGAASRRTRLGMERKVCREGGTGTELRSSQGDGSRVAGRRSQIEAVVAERMSYLREVAKNARVILSVGAGALEF